MSAELITLKNISYSVKNEQLSLARKDTADILFDINFSVFENEVLGICGESGGGKSTLAKLIAGLIKPFKGELILNANISVNKNKPKEIQILFQNNSDLINPFRKIITIIDEALKLSGTMKENISSERERLFETLDINPELLKRRGYGLSGGERQRIALARLLAVNPKVLVLDEPFSAQDVTSQINFIKVLKQINEEFNVTMVCISHDLQILRKLAHRVIVLQNGKIVEMGETSKIFSSPEHSYTKFLLRAEDFSLTEDEIHSFKINK